MREVQAQWHALALALASAQSRAYQSAAERSRAWCAVPWVQSAEAQKHRMETSTEAVRNTSCPSIHTHMRMHMHVHVHIHIHVHVHVHIRIHTYTHTHIRTYTHTHIRTYTHTQIHTSAAPRQGGTSVLQNSQSRHRPRTPIACQDLFRLLRERWCVWVSEIKAPYRASVMWLSFSADRTAIPCLILNEGLKPQKHHFWMYAAKSLLFQKIDKYIMQNQYLSFTRYPLSFKFAPHIKDSQSEPCMLSRKRPLHYASLIGVSIAEASKPEFSNVCKEIQTFSKKAYMKTMTPV